MSGIKDDMGKLEQSLESAQHEFPKRVSRFSYLASSMQGSNMLPSTDPWTPSSVQRIGTLNTQTPFIVEELAAANAANVLVRNRVSQALHLATWEEGSTDMNVTGSHVVEGLPTDTPLLCSRMHL